MKNYYQKQYELSNHLGNVLVTVSDKRVGVDMIDAQGNPVVDALGNYVYEDGIADGYFADVTSATDYYPFGMSVPGRTFNKNSYRFNFQGQETETELWGGEASFFKYRISDNRLGRFFSVDPLAKDYPWNSTYAFQENKLGLGIELEGAELLPFKSSMYQRRNGGRSIYLKVIKSNVPKSILSAHGHIMTNSDYGSHGPAGAYNHDQQFNVPTFVSADYYSKSPEWFGGYGDVTLGDIDVLPKSIDPKGGSTAANVAAGIQHAVGIYDNVHGNQAIWNGFGAENDHRRTLYDAFDIVAPLYEDAFSTGANNALIQEFVDVLNYVVDGTLPGHDVFKEITLSSETVTVKTAIGSYSKERVEYIQYIIGRGNDILSSEGIEIQSKTKDNNKTVK